MKLIKEHSFTLKSKKRMYSISVVEYATIYKVTAHIIGWYLPYAIDWKYEKRTTKNPISAAKRTIDIIERQLANKI